MKKIIFCITIALLLISSAVFADDLADVKQAGVLKMGYTGEYIPFVFEDESQNTTGLDVALMEEVCRRLGVKLQTLSFALDGVIDALNLGQIDVIGGGYSKTDTRAMLIDYTRAYYSGEAVVVAPKSMPKPQTVNPESFRGMKIAVEKGSSFQEWIQKTFVVPGYIPASNVYTYTAVADEMRALERKDVDLVMMDQDLYESCYRNSDNYQVFYSGFSTENYAFGLRKNSSLTAEINSQLNAMIKDGTAQSIANRFFAMNFCVKEQEIQRQVATLAPAPVVTAVPSTCVNAMSYVADVTVKDGQQFNPGAGFRKTWRIYNNGSCTWDSNYYLDFASGDRMQGGSARIPGTVKPGQTVDISVDLIAPSKAGNYKGNWQMRSPQGTGFGQTIWVSIKVNGSPVQPTARPTATPSDGQTRTIPVVNYYYASATEGKVGDSVTVYWSVDKASGVDIIVDGNLVDRSSQTNGALNIYNQIQNVGAHQITLTAHSVTDDTSSTIWYTMNGQTGLVVPEDGQRQIIPSIDYFYSDSDSGYSGDAATVYWSTTNAGGVTISVDGYQITNASSSGSYQLQAPLQGTGTHTITLTAHSVTDDASSSIYYTMNDRPSQPEVTAPQPVIQPEPVWSEPVWSESDWNEIEQALDSLTEEDWQALSDALSEIDWDDLE